MTFTVTGGTTEQQSAARKLWDSATFPRGFLEGHTVKLSFHSDVGSAYTARGGSIVMNASVTAENLWWILLHEIGHLADFWCLTPEGHQQVLTAVGRTIWDRSVQEWWAHSFVHTYKPPGKDYPQYPVPVDLIRELMDECGEGEDMASSEQIRNWFHDGVVLNHADRNTSGYTPECDHRQPTVGIPNDSGGVYNEPVHPYTVEAWEAYVTVMAFYWETITSAGGVNHCRNIGTGDMPSLHAYLCALDSPPNSRKSDKFIAAIEAIRTNSRAQVFRNLAGDRMHDQINCSPTDLASGINWSTVAGYQGEDMAVMPDNVQQFWVDVFDELGKLDPKTSASFAKALVEFKREHPATVSGITKGEADGRYVKTGGTYKIS